MSKIPRWYLYIAGAILVVGIVVGLLISGAAGAFWGGLLSLLGVSGANAVRRDRERTQAAILAHEESEREKEQIYKEGEDARRLAEMARKAREKQRDTLAREQDTILRKEGETLDVDGLLERAEREALNELEK